MERPLERDIQAKILRWLRRQPDVFAWPTVNDGSAVRGLPDIAGNVGLLALYLEVKRPGAKPTPIQTALHAKIRRRGAAVFVVESLDDAVAAVESLRREG